MKICILCPHTHNGGAMLFERKLKKKEWENAKHTYRTYPFFGG